MLVLLPFSGRCFSRFLLKLGDVAVALALPLLLIVVRVIVVGILRDRPDRPVRIPGPDRGLLGKSLGIDIYNRGTNLFGDSDKLIGGHR